ncbi:hypothetical protein EGT74_14170 [Chitinophaga lutea]|uniref:Signal transduction histidine kinase internal region domain-containing protein n=1 Tax=Chitinophaga lutea TaxID=2488634 RepID=A0A3N4PJ14_9BACT|nr:histidine kinase [Chitinophaga lutea]RPE08206.1 hypothetical protein EGT74_14170 [Chitinophaga lutea]
MNTFFNKYAVRIAVTLVFVVVAWTIRASLAPMPFYRHLLASIPVVIITQFIWSVLNLIHKLLNRWMPFRQYLYSRIILQITVGLLLVWGLRSFALYMAPRVLDITIEPLARAMIATINNLVSITVNLALISEYFTGRWKQSIVKAERLEKEKVQMQFMHLKNQVDPHFLFNAFTSLDSLVKTDPDLASRFIGHLSKVYRYALQHRDKDLVPLHTELSFLGHYITLQKIRFGPALEIDIQVDEKHHDRRVAMVTLQMLIDNAVKHNEVHAAHPLRIRIYVENDYLVVANNKQIRRQLAVSDKQGLQQLRQLYTFLGEREVMVQDGDDTFSVALPLL